MAAKKKKAAKKEAPDGTSRIPEPGKRLVSVTNTQMNPTAKTNNIRNWRLFRGVQSQGELADMTRTADERGIGLTRATICRLEGDGSLRKRYHEDHILLLSKVLKVAPRDLIGTNPYDAGDIFAVYALASQAERRKINAATLKITGKTST